MNKRAPKPDSTLIYLLMPTHYDKDTNFAIFRHPFTPKLLGCYYNNLLNDLRYLTACLLKSLEYKYIYLTLFISVNIIFVHNNKSQLHLKNINPLPYQSRFTKSRNLP